MTLFVSVNNSSVKGFPCGPELEYILVTTCRKNRLDMTVLRMRPYNLRPFSLKERNDKSVSQLKNEHLSC